jgi:hypothetical protein
MSSKLTSEALTDIGAKRPRAAGATSNCWNNFIKIPHTELNFLYFNAIKINCKE